MSSGLLMMESVDEPAQTQLGQLIKCPAGMRPSEVQITREELQELKAQYEFQLQSRSAYMSDLCPVRSEIHRELFDELVRQVYLDQEETGILLARIRDEAQMTVSNYQTMYETTVVQVTQQVGRSEEGYFEMRERVRKLEAEHAELLKEKTIAEAQLEQLDANITRNCGIYERQTLDDIEYMKKQVAQLKDALNSFL